MGQISTPLHEAESLRLSFKTDAGESHMEIPDWFRAFIGGNVLRLAIEHNTQPVVSLQLAWEDDRLRAWVSAYDPDRSTVHHHETDIPR